MSFKRMTEQELLEGLNAKGAHADELAELLPQELTPLERLKGSVKRYDRPTDTVWNECFDAQCSTREYVVALAAELGIRYHPTPDDTLAEIATRLAGDDVVTDEIEDLIVTLKRAGAISGNEMVTLLSRYLSEKTQI